MISLRPVQADDVLFLVEMLCEAAFPPGAERPQLDEAQNDPRLARWLDGWGRAGDLGVVAENEDDRVGAAWCRLFDDASVRLRGVIDEVTPELVVAVRPDARGRGIGCQLIAELINCAATAGFDGISLGVGETNPAVRLYRRLGFVEVHDGRKPWTMYRKLGGSVADSPTTG